MQITVDMRKQDFQDVLEKKLVWKGSQNVIWSFFLA